MKVFGIDLSTSLIATVDHSWDRCQREVLAAIAYWSGRHLPTLRLKRDALEVFCFSKLWYLAQMLPLPTAVANRINSAAGAFLWRGHLERLAWQELHSPFLQGGLQLSDLVSRGQALLAKQFCWAVGLDGPSKHHWAYWLGRQLADVLPQLEDGQHAPTSPPYWLQLADIIRELLAYDTVAQDGLQAATAKALYSSFMDSPPPPKIEARLDHLPWPLMWRRLWYKGLPHDEANTAFKLLHNILPVNARLARFGLPQQAACPHCPGVPETALHFFTSCQRISAMWQQLVAKLLPFTGPVADEELLMLAWPATALDADITAVMLAYIHLVWAARGDRRPPSFSSLQTLMRARPALVLSLL